jgi:hypothetical protein
MHEPVSSRRRISPALVAVVVVLAGAAGTGAYLVARQVMAPAGTVASGPGTVRTTTAQVVPPAGTGSAVANPVQTPIPAQTSFPPPTADACPAFTVAAVKAAGRPGALQLRLYVDGALSGTDGAEAWICEDSDGSLYYQGHNKTGAATNATTSNTILIGPGIRGTVVKAGTGYSAKNPSNEGQTEYIVNLEVLSVRLPSGDLQTYTVTRHVPN